MVALIFLRGLCGHHPFIVSPCIHCTPGQHVVLRKKSTIHQVTTILAIFNNLFPDHNNLLTTSNDDSSFFSSSLCHLGLPPPNKISLWSVHNFSCNFANSQRRTNITENITSFAKEVITSQLLWAHCSKWFQVNGTIIKKLWRNVSILQRLPQSGYHACLPYKYPKIPSYT